MRVYLINERRKRKMKNKFKAIGFNPNFWDNPLDSGASSDGAFATLGDDSGPSESVVFHRTGNAIEIEQLLLDSGTDKRLNSIHEQFSYLPVIFNPGIRYIDKFSMFERLYGNYVILKHAIRS